MPMSMLQRLHHQAPPLVSPVWAGKGPAVGEHRRPPFESFRTALGSQTAIANEDGAVETALVA